MTKIRISILLYIIISLLSLSYSQSNSNYTVVDDLGRNIEFDGVPQKIIALAPSLTEYVFALGCNDRLVGNTTYCNYPPAAESITKVGDMVTFDYERILSLEPDLILITIEGNTKESYDKINGLGLKTFVVNPHSYENIKKAFSKIAAIFKKDSLASEMINNWDLTIEKISLQRKKYADKTVMIIVDLSPLMLAGKNTFLNEYLEITGLRNIAEDSPVNYPIFNREEILSRNPDYIIYPSDGTKTSSQLFEYYPEWRELKAYRKNRIIFVDRDMYFRPGPRFVKSLLDLNTKLNND